MCSNVLVRKYMCYFTDQIKEMAGVESCFDIHYVLDPPAEKKPIRSQKEQRRAEAARRREARQQEKAKEQAKAGKPATGKKDTMETYKRDNTPMPDYYKAWDKLAKDIDEEDGSDEEVKGELEAAKNPVWHEEKKAQTQAEMLQRTRGASSRRNS